MAVTCSAEEVTDMNWSIEIFSFYAPDVEPVNFSSILRSAMQDRVISEGLTLSSVIMGESVSSTITVSTSLRGDGAIQFLCMGYASGVFFLDSAQVLLDGESKCTTYTYVIGLP